MPRLSGKVAFVTAAGGGIGRTVWRVIRVDLVIPSHDAGVLSKGYFD
jgi:hypothetical protein